MRALRRWVDLTLCLVMRGNRCSWVGVGCQRLSLTKANASTESSALFPEYTALLHAGYQRIFMHRPQTLTMDPAGASVAIRTLEVGPARQTEQHSMAQSMADMGWILIR